MRAIAARTRGWYFIETSRKGGRPMSPRLSGNPGAARQS